MLFEVEALAASVSQPDHRTIAKSGQALAAIRLHLLEPSTFTTVRLHEQVKTITVKKRVLMLAGLCIATGGICKQGSGMAIRVVSDMQMDVYPC